jgi:peroxiredoxin
MTDETPILDTVPRRGRSPALLIFLLFPILGLVAAGIIVMTENRAIQEATPAAVTLPTSPPQRQLTGEPAPDFEVRTLAQTTTKLSDYRGRIVFLNFWATWCGPCERELPAFQAFMAQQPDDGPIVLAVDMGETFDQVNAYLTERNITGFPILLDARYVVSDQYGIGPIPVTYVIDKEGIIRYSKFGEMKADDLSGYLTALQD